MIELWQGVFVYLKLSIRVSVFGFLKAPSLSTRGFGGGYPTLKSQINTANTKNTLDKVFAKTT